MRVSSEARLTPLVTLLALAGGLRAQKTRNFEFQVETLDGTRLTQADFKDKVLLVDFWGTWCGPCRKAVPVLSRLYREYEDQGLAILGLNYEQVAPERAADLVRRFARKHEIPYPLAIGSQEIKAQVPRFRGYPTMLFFRRGLRLDRVHAGFDDAEAKRIETWIKKALADEGSKTERQDDEKPRKPVKTELFLDLASGGKIQIAGQERHVLLVLVHPRIGPSKEDMARLEALAREHEELEIHRVARAGLGGPGDAVRVTRASLAKVRLGKAYPAYVLFSPEGKGLVRAAGLGKDVVERVAARVSKALEGPKVEDEPATRPSKKPPASRRRIRKDPLP